MRFKLMLPLLLLLATPMMALADDDSEKKALLDQYVAMCKSAETAKPEEWVKNFFCGKDPDDKKLADAMTRQYIGYARFQKAVRDKWGGDAESKAAKELGFDTEADIKALKPEVDKVTEAGKEKTGSLEKGDNVSAMPIYMVKVDGKWKIDASEMVSVLDEQVPAVIKRFGRQDKLMSAAADDVISGKYKTIDEAIDGVHAAYKKAAAEAKANAGN